MKYRYLYHGINGFWWVLLGLIVILISYVVAGRYLAEQVYSYKQDVESWASESLGLPIYIDQLEGDWSLFSPIVRINGLSVHPPVDADGDPGRSILDIASIEAKLDVASSLLHLTPVFGALRVNGVATELKLSEDGVWNFPGMTARASSDSSPSEPFDWTQTLEAIDKITRLLLLQEEIQLSSLHLHLFDQSETPHKFTLNQVRLTRYQSSSLVEGDFVVDGKKSHGGRIVMSAKGSPLADSFDASGFIELSQAQWMPIIALFMDDSKIQAADFGGKVWFEIEKSELQTASLTLSIANLEWKIKHPHQLQDTDLQLYLKKSRESWVVQSRSSMVNLDSERFKLPDLNLRAHKGFSQFDVELHGLDLEAIIRNIRKGVGWPDVVEEYIQPLSPKGVLDHALLSLYFQNFEFKDFQLTAKASSLSVAPWSGAPSADNLSVHARITSAGGEVLFTGKQPSLFFPDLYHEAWQLEYAKGRVRYRVMDDYVTVWGDQLVISHSSVSAVQGFFDLYLSFDDNISPSTLTLGLGIKDVDVKAHNKFVPYVVGEGLTSWLDDALLNGKSKLGAVLFHGPIVDDNSTEKVQVYLEPETAKLKYQPGWPVVENIAASLWIEDQGVEAKIFQASTLGGRLKEGTVKFPYRREGGLEVDLKLSGDTGEGFQYLTNTPLSEIVGEEFQTWKVRGNHSTKFRINVPIDTQDDVDVDLSTDLKNTDLSLSKLNLEFKNVNGDLHYSTQKGLSSKQLKSELFGYPLNVSIDSEMYGTNMVTNAHPVGRQSIQNVNKWLGFQRVGQIEGEFNLSGALRIDNRPHRDSFLQINTDLVGVTSLLPEPFSKPRDAITDTYVKVVLKTNPEVYVGYGEQLQLALELADKGVSRGQIFFGHSPAYLSAEPGIEVRGHIPFIPVDDWQIFIEKEINRRDSTAQKNKGSQEASSTGVRLVDLSVEQIRYKDASFDNTRLRLRPNSEGWDVAVESPLIKGVGFLSEKSRVPHSINLAYIHWPLIEEPEAESETSVSTDQEALDPLKDFDISALPPFDLKVGEIFVGPENFGRWDVELRQEKDRLRLDIKDAFIKNMQLVGRMYWHSNSSGMMTEIPILKIKTDDFGNMQRAWRTDAAIEAKESQANIHLKWNGSPAAFNKETLEGRVKFHLTKVRAQVEGQAAKNAKLFGIANLGALGRRFQGDFSDIVEPGVEFEKIFGTVSINDQLIKTLGTIKAQGTLIKGELSGKLDLRDLNIDAEVLGTLSLTSQLPLFAVLIGVAPPVAASLFVAEQLTGGQLERLASFVYEVKGPVGDPDVSLKKAFDKSIEGKEEAWYQKLLKSSGKSVDTEQLDSEENKAQPKINR